MHVHNFEAIVTTFYHIVFYLTADCISRDVSIIYSPLTFKIRYGYELGAWGLLLFPLVLMNRLNKTESAVFLYCRIFLFFQIN